MQVGIFQRKIRKEYVQRMAAPDNGFFRLGNRANGFAVPRIIFCLQGNSVYHLHLGETHLFGVPYPKVISLFPHIRGTAWPFAGFSILSIFSSVSGVIIFSCLQLDIADEARVVMIRYDDRYQRRTLNPSNRLFPPDFAAGGCCGPDAGPASGHSRMSVELRYPSGNRVGERQRILSSPDPSL